MTIESRIKKIETKLKPDKESEVVPRVIIRTADKNTKGKGVEIVYEEAEKQGNEPEISTTD